MATTNEQVSQEYILIKCFLYKYTPPYTQVTLPDDQTNDFSLSTFTPYSVPLDDTTYFTKYDISQFVTEYSFDQNISETTYSWSITLQDLALSYATINSTLKVKPPQGSTQTNGLSFSNANSSNSVGLLSEYEASANTFDNNDYTSDDAANPILNAKFQRGAVPGPLTVQNSNLASVQSTVPGLRLSDLIQEYDFISVFLYKNTTPLTNIYGIFNTDNTLTNNPLYVFNYMTTSDVTPTGSSFPVGMQNPTDPYLQYESVLLTQMPNGQTLFSNEFNGFVIRKNPTTSIDQVDRVIIGGNGWSRLFGATRRAVKTSLFANALYQTGQVTGLSDLTPFENIFAGQPISSIIRSLFDTVYKIDFDLATSAELAIASIPINPNNSTNLESSTLDQEGFFASPLGGSTTGNEFTSTAVAGAVLLGDSFYNITSLVVANAYPANLFSVPPYLLSSVMKLRPFAYIEPASFPVSSAYISSAQAAAAQLQEGATGPAAQTTQISPETFQQATQALGGQVTNYSGTSPVFIDPTVQNLKAYFQFLDTVFLAFSPELQTPYEILDQIRNITFVEIYEQPSGQFIVRSPQYNNLATSVPGRSDIAMIRSSNLNIISTSYPSTAESLVSKIITGYSPDILPVSLLQQFGYCDGKLLTQFGQLEMETAANPNASTASLSNSATNNSLTTGIFGWAEYLMELSNAKLKTGTIVCDYDNTIQVGNTYIDENKFKFGYIVGVNKHVLVTGTATMSLALTYVRDAVPKYGNVNTSTNVAPIVDVNMDLLPVLTDIENSFASGS